MLPSSFCLTVARTELTAGTQTVDGSHARACARLKAAGEMQITSSKSPYLFTLLLVFFDPAAGGQGSGITQYLRVGKVDKHARA